MARFFFFAPFSSESTDLFLGDVDSDTDTKLVLLDEDIRLMEVSGSYFDKATGQRDGTVKGLTGGRAILDEDGNPTGQFAIDLRINDLDADRSRFDDLYLAQDSFNLMGLLAGNDDQFFGSGFAEDIRGAQGDDRMAGNGGDDILSGGFGVDTVNGGAGDDLVRGDDGNDLLRGNAGDDTLVGGADRDTMVGGGGDDVLRGGGDNDMLRGASGVDILRGGGGDDTLKGGGGADQVRGEAGDDRLIGNGGADTLIGGAGDDTLTGGQRADTFTFNRSSGDDTVTDFRDGVDLIQITGGLSFADIDIQAVGNNTLITFGGASVTLVREDAGDITIDDFLF